MLTTGSDKLRTTLEKPYATSREHALAYAHLLRRHAEGALDPIPEWIGSSVSGYAEMLGLDQKLTTKQVARIEKIMGRDRDCLPATW